MICVLALCGVKVKRDGSRLEHDVQSVKELVPEKEAELTSLSFDTSQFERSPLNANAFENVHTTLFRLDVSQFDMAWPVKALVFSNVAAKFDTFDVSHLDKSALNSYVLANAPFKVVTCAVSQFDKPSPMKLIAPSNIDDIVVTLDVSHLDKSALNPLAL